MKNIESEWDTVFMKVARNFYQPMTNSYSPDHNLYNKTVPHWSKFLSYNTEKGLASPSLLTRSWPSSLAFYTPSPGPPPSVMGCPTINKNSTLTGGLKGAGNLQNHQLNSRAALVCQHKDVMSQSRLRHQDPIRDRCQNIHPPCPTKAHIYGTTSSNRQELIARCIVLQDLTLEKLHFPMNGSWSLVSRELPFHKLKKEKQIPLSPFWYQNLPSSPPVAVFCLI